jgi:hypothetical protein
VDALLTPETLTTIRDTITAILNNHKSEPGTRWEVAPNPFWLSAAGARINSIFLRGAIVEVVGPPHSNVKNIEVQGMAFGKSRPLYTQDIAMACLIPVTPAEPSDAR